MEGDILRFYCWLIRKAALWNPSSNPSPYCLHCGEPWNKFSFFLFFFSKKDIYLSPAAEQLNFIIYSESDGASVGRFVKSKCPLLSHHERWFCVRCADQARWPCAREEVILCWAADWACFVFSIALCDRARRDAWLAAVWDFFFFFPYFGHSRSS